MRTTACTSSTVDGAIAADARRSSGSSRSGEYAARYSATSSSLLKTHSLPTADSKAGRALSNVLWLRPAGKRVGMARTPLDVGRILGEATADRTVPLRRRMKFIEGGRSQRG